MTANAEPVQRVTQAQPAPPGTPHPDPILAGKGWRSNERGFWARQPEADREAGS